MYLPKVCSQAQCHFHDTWHLKGYVIATPSPWLQDKHNIVKQKLSTFHSLHLYVQINKTWYREKLICVTLLFACWSCLLCFTVCKCLFSAENLYHQFKLILNLFTWNEFVWIMDGSEKYLLPSHRTSAQHTAVAVGFSSKTPIQSKIQSFVD